MSDDVTVYEPGSTPKGTNDLAEFYKFDVKQFRFLEEYAKDLDEGRAANAAGVRKAAVQRWMTQDKFQNEVMEIHKVWRTQIKMTAEFSSAKHLELMGKFESDYDAGSLVDKAKMAPSLARMSDSYMRATGHFHQESADTGTNVVINIDLGGEDRPVVIEGQKE